MSGPVDCDLLTGYLGSGKTTLLNAWLRSPASAGTAVVVNEIGDIGIDQLVLAQLSDNVTLLESGCLCCTLSGALRETLLDLCAMARARGMALRRIVIETTGLAEPLPVLHALLGDRALSDAVRLNQVIATLDGEQGRRQLATRPESLRQLAVAEKVVLTKPDLVSPPELAALRATVTAVNPNALIHESVAGDAAEAVFGTGAGQAQRQAVLNAMAGGRNAGAGGGGHAPHAPNDRHDPHAGREHGLRHAAHAGASSLSFYIDHTIPWAGLAAWWHLVSGLYGHDLLRCKGLLRMRDTDRPFVFMQTVGTVFHRPDPVERWPDADPRSRLVCIGVGLDPDWLARSLAALRIDEPGARPGSLADLSHFVPSCLE